MKTALIASGLMLLGSCASDAGGPPDKRDISKKADSATACTDLGLPADCDVCAEFDWYEDGECDSFCKTPDPDCGAGVPAAITTQLSGGALPPVHPALGVWAIDKPGVFPRLSWFASMEELRAADGIGIGFALEPHTCSIEVGASHFDPCDEDEVQPEEPSTCTMAHEGNGERTPITAIHKLMVEFDLGTPTPADRAAARATEQAIRYEITAGGVITKFYYGEIEGQIFLLAVDAASLDCSA